MDHLSKYIDWYIRKQITENDAWRKLEVVFSNEKVPGEGEHKLIDYIRKHGKDDETYCINALDADLVMLSLGTHKKKFYLLREELYDQRFDYAYLNVGSGLRNDLASNVLHWKGADETKLINDFILFCFLCGNDFLPNIPSISLVEKGMSTIIDMYKTNAETCGHLTDDQGEIKKESFQLFLSRIGQCEKSLLEEKFLKQRDYVEEDSLLNKHTKVVDGVCVLDFDQYREDSNAKHGIHNLDDACHSYADGCSWVLNYYLKGINDWSFVYKYNYAPFAYDLTLSLTTYAPRKLSNTGPIPPFLQLLCVIPPTSSTLLPRPLNTILTNRSFEKYFPTSFNINYEGKKKEWEGVVELPIVDIDEIKKEYTRLLPKVDLIETKRNISGKSFVYRFSHDFSTYIKSFYGSFTSLCVSEVIHL
jgi:5'-3' exoribonuclease 1